MPSGEPFLLAIDTSTEVAGLALYDGSLVSEMSWAAGRNQTQSTIEQLRNLLAINHRSMTELGAVAVAIGPGSFNGLRVGVSLAKGLCYGLELPIFGVVTLDLVAYPHARSRTPIRAVVRAGRGRVVFADYRYRHGRWERLGEMLNRPFEELTANLPDKVLIAGEIDPARAASLERDTRVTLPPPALRLRRPSYLAEIGYQRWQRGEPDDLARLEPVYIHGALPSKTKEETPTQAMVRSVQASK